MITRIRIVLLFTLVGFAIQNVNAIGQISDTNDGEIQAVFRISKQFLDESTQNQITARLPFTANVIGFQCCGTIHGQAKLVVELTEQRREAVFSITSTGQGQACVSGKRGPIVAYGSASGPFSTVTRVRFDGRRFAHLETTPNSTVCGTLHRITGHKDRRIGRAVGRGMIPLANKILPRAVTAAVPVANRYLKSFVEQAANQVIEILNSQTPLEETAFRLFPKTRDWRFQVSSTNQYIQSAYGPPNAVVPPLAQSDHPWDQIRVQIWLRSTNEEAESLARLSQLPLAKELMKKYVQSTIPELDRFGKKRTIEAVEGWVVITFQSEQPSPVSGNLRTTETGSFARQ